MLLVVFEQNGDGSPNITVVIDLYHIHVWTFSHCHIFRERIIYNYNYDIHSGDKIELCLGILLRMYVCSGWNRDHSLLACMNLIANSKGVLSALFPAHTVLTRLSACSLECSLTFATNN